MLELILRKLNEIRDEQAHSRAHFDRRLDHLRERIILMAIDTSKLTAVADQLVADGQKNADDIAAVLAMLGGVSTDPQTQAVIDDVVAKLSPLASRIEASNASLEAVATPPAPPSA